MNSITGYSKRGGVLCWGQHEGQQHKNAAGSLPSAWGYNWATLFLRDINIWPRARFGEFQIWGSKVQSWVLQDSDLKVNVLASPSSSYRLQTTSYYQCQQTHSSLTVINIWSWAPDGCLTPRLADWLSAVTQLQLQASSLERGVLS
jgi:hypothetical protein